MKKTGIILLVFFFFIQSQKKNKVKQKKFIYLKLYFLYLEIIRDNL